MPQPNEDQNVNEYVIPLEISVLVGQKHDKPQIELRRMTTDPEIIKKIVSCAFHKRPIIIQPIFKDQIRSIGNLIQKGIIYEDREQYFFSI